MADIEFKKLDKSHKITENEIVKVTKMGHIVEIIHTSKSSDTLAQYVKINKDTYAVIDRNTGEVVEIKEYNLNENRAQNKSGLKHTMKKIRDLINNNFTGAQNELFITLTYRFIDEKPMNDVHKASKDFDIFIKRFRRKYPDLEYIAVLEPQENTAWHWHVLAKFTAWTIKKHIILDNNKIVEPLWGHGFTKTQIISNVDNIGAYLSSYLANIEINDENKSDVFDAVYKDGCKIVLENKTVTGDNGKKTTKKFIKGGRMYLYPSGTNIYRYSRGIKKPEQQKMTYYEAKNIIGKEEPDYSRTIQVEGCQVGCEKRTYNYITYEHYNLKRKKKKLK